MRGTGIHVTGIGTHVTTGTETETHVIDMIETDTILEIVTDMTLVTETDMIHVTETDTIPETHVTAETDTTTGHVTTETTGTDMIEIGIREIERDTILGMHVIPEILETHVTSGSDPGLLLVSESHMIRRQLLLASRSDLRSEEDERLQLHVLHSIVLIWRSERHVLRLLRTIRWATLLFETITIRLLNEE